MCARATNALVSNNNENNAHPQLLSHTHTHRQTQTDTDRHTLQYIHKAEIEMIVFVMRICNTLHYLPCIIVNIYIELYDVCYDKIIIK